MIKQLPNNAFACRIEKMNEDLSYVTMLDNKGRSTYASCSSAMLKKKNFKEGGFFRAEIIGKSLIVRPIKNPFQNLDAWDQMCIQGEKNNPYFDV